MGKINVGRVILGGLVAGVVVNIGEFVLNDPVLGQDWAAAMQSLNRSEFSGNAITLFIVLGFILGIASVWTYAAIRPRFGAGPKTALCAGLLAWFFGYFYAGIGMYATGLFPTKLAVAPILWGLVQVPLATVAGASLYKEA